MYHNTLCTKYNYTLTRFYVIILSVLQAGEVIGGSWSSILFSLDVAVGLWPLLREGLRSSRLRPGALTRPCAS